jgi:hypothetical protein
MRKQDMIVNKKCWRQFNVGVLLYNDEADCPGTDIIPSSCHESFKYHEIVTL